MTAGIQLVEVCRHFELGATDVKALDNINLEIDQGEFVALVGVLLPLPVSPAMRGD